MSNKPKKGIMNNVKVWLPNLYYICTSITLIFIMAQAFFARRANIEASEWEKAKVTIDNIERFKENLKETALYDNQELLSFSDQLWSDFTTHESWLKSEILKTTYLSFFDYDFQKSRTDFEKSLAIFDAFAYPIVMGYASEMGSFQSVMFEFFSYGNYIIFMLYDTGKDDRNHIRLLYRLWRVRYEQILFKIPNIDENQLIEIFQKNKIKLLCFEGEDVTPATIKQYEKKLEKELKKIQKEIKVFRKSSLK